MSDAVRVEGVHKRFGRLEVLRGVDLAVDGGEVLVLIGPSGSGKSTLLRCINHLEKIDAGRIYVNGELVGYREVGGKLHELTEREVARRRARVGMVFQRLNLFPHLTVLGNIVEAPVRVRCLPLREAEARAHELLRRVGLDDRAGAYPAQLSGGSSSGWPSPGPWPWTPRSCSSTNPPARSTPSWWARSSTSCANWPGTARP
jgi:polar amino acid transport system ATP-binding protein